MTLYTDKVKNIVHTAVPQGLIVDIVDYGAHLGMRVYRDNINSFPDYKQQQMYRWINTTLELVNAIAPCILEAESTPPNVRKRK